MGTSLFFQSRHSYSWASIDMASLAEVQCSRCGKNGHSAAECEKSFMRVLCSQCNRFGHSKASCPQLRQCHFCNGLGHLARDCPKKAAEKDAAQSQTASKGKGKGKGKGKPVGASAQSKEDDEVSVQSESTVATRTDINAYAPAQKCNFCGAPRVAPKYKRGQNACKDRCQQCFRSFK